MPLEYDLDSEIESLRKRFHLKLAAKRGLNIEEETDIHLLEHSDKRIQSNLLRLHRKKRRQGLLRELFSFILFRRK